MPEGPRTDQPYVESHESEFMNAKDQAASHARAKVLNEPDVKLQSSSYLKEIQARADRKAAEASLSVETLEEKDPIRRIILALERSATKETDNELVTNQIHMLEKQRADWIDFLNAHQTQKGSIKDAIQNSNKWPTLTDIKNGKPIIHFEVIKERWIPIDGKGSPEAFHQIRKGFLHNVLEELGILKTGETPDVLTKLSHLNPAHLLSKPDNSPWYSDTDKLARNLATNIPGITAEVSPITGKVGISFGVQTLKKIVAFPALV